MKSILILTSGQPSINPRLVKEADALADAGYKVTVIYQHWTEWATKLDETILQNSKWEAICIGGSPTSNRFMYWETRLLHKASKLLVKWFGLRDKISELALGRCTLLLMQKAKNIPADLYIAHNLAALPAAVVAAKKNHSKCGFDAEDFHRNETSDDKLNPAVLLNTYIEDKYIKQLDYFTSASPLISSAYKELYPSLAPTNILNVFPRQANHTLKMPKNGSLRLFWFSQTIGLKRGLEEVIKAMGILKAHAIELHLLGNIDVSIRNHFSTILQENGLENNVIFYYPPIPADEIFSFASKFDIGLATEISTPKNRDICLTNKIFTYVQAGLAIIASDTAAQKQFMAEYANMGEVYEKKDPVSLVRIIKNCIENEELLIQYQQQSFKYANETLNWEIEKEKFLSIINQQLVAKSS
ncbi:glycosyltransferase family 4 protein [Pedobacter polaris]|uniref:Glycosyltransferase family 4 protein n=1 Tax=Pedobacter polaris TaxID=2571273 RepID=A0A4V5NZD6_9SPHI|nr:glycosyltransferase family 4 protein [Pedobacter polaris]TKC08175.1 glycosyltransferase family 4 protein [Pedobacter polaris]